MDNVLHNIQLKLFLLTFLPISLCFFWVFQYLSTTFKLSRFPTLGSSLPILSLFTEYEFAANAQKVIEQGIRKWPHRLFKIPFARGWRVVVVDSKLIDELSKAPEYLLSGRRATEKTLQTNFTLGPQILANPYHRAIIRGRLTRSIPQLFPDMYEEMADAMTRYIPPSREWHSTAPYEIITKTIVRVNNRIFVGLPLCRDPEWIELCTTFTTQVVKRAYFFSFLPQFLRPWVTNFPNYYREGLRLLGPHITAMRAEMSTGGDDQPEKSEKLLNWLMHAAKGDEKEDEFLVARMLTMNFVSVHTTSMAMTHALFDLASSSPEYLHRLREEAEVAIEREGWTKTALDQMQQMDSFIKESQRLHPLAALLMNREVVNDYIFADGTMVPAGTTLSVGLLNANINPDIYDDPLKFDGSRFIKMKEQNKHLDGHSAKFDMVSTNVNSLSFGHGRHVCPGRFFASTLLKMILAYVVINYDVKMKNEGVRPPDNLFANRISPSRTAEVMFRSRNSV